jgi:hypothetical protein
MRKVPASRRDTLVAVIMIRATERTLTEQSILVIVSYAQVQIMTYDVLSDAVTENH